ncbi:hypothetical protein F7725_007531 [Dissostichus mawsoni]|uniref:KASH domain-containing protein n=1 Tax=Dissostichus mawsoni TaxID=36200 RepID=A0A7J5Y7S2_DISMA|nr:hypothetical protein F7725_007531 [Dissostichus mawsoni]
MSIPLSGCCVSPRVPKLKLKGNRSRGGWQVKGELLDSVFGPERADGLQGELTAAVRNRELLHAQLLSRESQLQGLISRTKDFDAAYESLRSKLSALRHQLVAADSLQPDILAKKSQADRFMSFHNSLLNREKWLMIMKQKLESFHSQSGEWSIEGRQHEAERALGEFPEKELQLQQMEVQGQGVLERTSEEGGPHPAGHQPPMGFLAGPVQHEPQSTQTTDRLCLLECWRSVCRPLPHITAQSGGGAMASFGSKPGGRDRRAGGSSGGGLIQSHHSEGHLILSAQDNTPLNSPRTGEDRGDLGDTHLQQSRTERLDRPPPDGSTGSERSAGAADRGGAAFTIKGGGGQYQSRRREFEAWLSNQNALLSGVSSSKAAALSTKELKTRQDTLRALRAELSWGQEHFQLLLQESQSAAAGPGPAEDVGLEELRYRWMLYKSKVKDVGELRTRAKRVQAQQEEPAVAAKVQKRAGLWQRVCRLALPLWLLLLALLLLAFLLPFMDEGSSCSLTNNFARSFNVMLRYNGPPPT